MQLCRVMPKACEKKARAISASGSQMYSRTVAPVASSSAITLPHRSCTVLTVALAVPELVMTRVISCSKPL